MRPFDTFIMVDWSGGNDRGAAPKADAIWAAVLRPRTSVETTYLRNRATAEQFLGDIIEQERAQGHKLLIGFDFPFGYPEGFGAALTGSSDPIEVIDWFARRITDSPKSNNRFDIAGEINSVLGSGKGPFWANALGRDIAGLSRTKAGYVNPFPERRVCEGQAKGSFTCWQLAGVGAVGSQTIMGLPVLARLRAKFGACVWPFERLESDVAMIEVWPSLTVGPAPDGMIKDDWQVAELTRQIAGLAPARLAGMLDIDAPQEGWIFGLGFEQELMSLRPEPVLPPLRNDCFALPQGVHWTPVDEALALLRDRLTPVTAVETVALSQACGRIAAVDVTAPRANPPLPNTAVDGYGFAGGRGEGTHRVPLVQGRAAAGDAPADVPAGYAIRVLTGAALPRGVDTVILQEDVLVEDGHIVFRGVLKQGSNTRRAGEDVQAGDVTLRAGRVITPADLALLAATGVAQIAVRRPLRVGVLSTGDELAEAGAPVADGQIYDANRPMLLALLARLNHCAVDLGRAPDDRAGLRAMLDTAAGQVDAIITSGGASAGDEDHVSALLEHAGAMALWRIAMKPGRPLALGLWQGVPVFGLPGNPVAALVCALVFAQPALAQLAGADWTVPQGFDVPAAFKKRKKAGRREYLRARMREGQIEVFASEGSGRISGLTWAEGLVELGEEAQDIRAGDPVRFIPFGSFGL